jgi:hypothetical protein
VCKAGGGGMHVKWLMPKPVGGCSDGARGRLYDTPDFKCVLTRALHNGNAAGD